MLYRRERESMCIDERDREREVEQSKNNRKKLCREYDCTTASFKVFFSLNNRERERESESSLPLFCKRVLRRYIYIYIYIHACTHRFMYIYMYTERR